MAAETTVKTEIPDRVWDLYFGPKGAIPRLEKTINLLCTKLDTTASNLDQTRKDMQRYNELRPEIQKWSEAVIEHKRFCERVQAEKHTIERTNEEWQEKIREERQSARDEAWRHFKVVTTIIALILSGLGFVVGMVWPMLF